MMIMGCSIFAVIVGWYLFVFFLTLFLFLLLIIIELVKMARLRFLLHFCCLPVSFIFLVVFIVANKRALQLFNYQNSSVIVLANK